MFYCNKIIGGSEMNKVRELVQIAHYHIPRKPKKEEVIAILEKMAETSDNLRELAEIYAYFWTAPTNTKTVMGLAEKIRGGESCTPLEQFVLVRDGFLYATDRAILIKAKTDMDEGAYIKGKLVADITPDAAKFTDQLNRVVAFAKGSFVMEKNKSEWAPEKIVDEPAMVCTVPGRAECCLAKKYYDMIYGFKDSWEIHFPELTGHPAKFLADGLEILIMPLLR